MGDSHYARPGNGGSQDLNEWKYGILLAAEEVVRAEVLSLVPGSESEHVSSVSPFVDWSGFVGWCSVVGAFFCLLWWCFSLRSLTNLYDRVQS